MLVELRVENLALVESARLGLGPGLNVLTGETGAGKSLIVAALALLGGGRWSREMLRTGASSASVRGLFEVADDALAAEVLGLVDEAPEESPAQVLVVRRIDASGRNRCEIQGNQVPVALLRRLGDLLFEIHGQNEHRALLDETRQTRLLDRTAGLEPVRQAFEATLTEWRSVRRRRDELARDAGTRERRIEELLAITEEVAAVDPRPGECDELRAERDLLAAAERHAGAVSSALDMLNDADAATDLVGRAQREIEETAALSPETAAAAEALERAADALDEAVRSLTGAAQGLVADPERLETVQDRLEAVGALLRRHGPTEQHALDRAAEAAELLSTLRGDEGDLAAVEQRLDAAAQSAFAAGLALDDARREHGGAFATAVCEDLAGLEMPNARFAVRVPEHSGSEALDEATSLGLAPACFVASPNPGEELRPLARIASGGELARTALAIAGRLADVDATGTVVFDEIDADVGPRLGDVIGARLARLAKGRQVLVVTHLPQVAAHGDLHLRVSKATADDGRTRVAVNELSGPDRVREIAEMMRGPGHVDEALEQAESMLRLAGGAPS